MKKRVFFGMIFTIAILIGAGVCIALDINPLASLGFASGLATLATIPTLVFPVDLDAKATASVIEHYMKKCGEEIELNGKVSTETKSAMDNLLKKFNENQEAADAAMKTLRADFDALSVQHKKFIEKQAEKKSVITAVKELFLKNEVEIKDAVRGKRPYSIDLKGYSAIEKKTTILESGNTGDVIAPFRIPGLQYDPAEFIRIRDFIPIVPITSNTMYYVKENVLVNGAAVQTEGSAKGEVSTTWTQAAAPVATIACWTKVSEQMFDDMPMLLGYFQYKYINDLLDVEDTQLVYGSGVTPNITGLSINAANYSDYLAISTVQRIDVILNAITQLRIAKYRPTAVFINPADYLKIVTTKDTTGQYIFQTDVRMGIIIASIGGCPLVQSTAITADDFLIGDFRTGALIGDRMSPSVVIDREQDDFTKNLLTIRFEERLAMAQLRPNAFIFDTFTNALAKGSA